MREEVHTLSKALQENRMEVWYQPIMNTETGKFDCAEALIRMKAADGSYVPPGRFIPAAERRIFQAATALRCRRRTSR